MSELMVLGFENEAEADAFGLKLAQMQHDLIVQLQDAAEVVRNGQNRHVVIAPQVPQDSDELILDADI